MRGRRSAGVAHVLEANEQDLIVAPMTGSQKHVKVPRRTAERMRGRDQKPALLLCGETESFRRLARSQLLKSDSVLEIGCSYGLATASIAARSKHVIAVDVSAEALSRAATEACQRFENIQFVELDATRDLPRLVDMARASGVSAVFIDINGNRQWQSVAPLLRTVHEQLSPRVIVVKNRELYEAAVAFDTEQTCDDAVEADDNNGHHDAALLRRSDEFWRAALAAEDEAPLGTRGFSYKNPLTQIRQWATTRVRHETRAQQMVGHPLDSDDYRAMITSWRSAGPNSEATTIFTRQSTMDPSMRIEVRERSHGWRTLHLLGGRRDIINGVANVDGSSPTDSNNNKPPPAAVLVNEYLMSMASVGLAALEARGKAAEPRCLFLGLGGGALPTFMAHHLPAAKLVAVEIDEAACEAATKHMGLDATRCTIVCADGLEWVEALGDDDEVFDAVFVDIFDERNLCPQGFYSDSFLQKLSKQMADDAVIAHNLHAGSKTLDAEIEVAEAAYERVFGAVRRSSTLDSKPWAGNAIIGASRAGGVWEEAALLEAADAAKSRLGVGFDLAGRLSCVAPVE